MFFWFLVLSTDPLAAEGVSQNPKICIFVTVFSTKQKFVNEATKFESADVDSEGGNLMTGRVIFLSTRVKAFSPLPHCVSFYLVNYSYFFIRVHFKLLCERRDMGASW